MSTHQNTAYSFGQTGSAFLSDTSLYTPPAGMVVVGIVSLADTTKFTTLTPVDTGDAGFITTGTPSTMCGTNADSLPDSQTFPAGVALYGRWSNVTLAAGQVLIYLGF